jgi:hypothetical protein
MLLESTPPPAAQLRLSQSQPGDLVGHHLRLSNIRESDPVVNFFTRQTLPTVNRKHFFMKILRVESSCPQKTHNITLLFGCLVL